MARAPWHIIGALEDINDSVFLWESMFKSILDNHIKKRIVKFRYRSLPWMNTEIRKAMNRRYKYLREAHVILEIMNYSAATNSKGTKLRQC